MRHAGVRRDSWSGADDAIDYAISVHDGLDEEMLDEWSEG